MANTSYFLFLTLVAVVILSSLITVLADDEGPLQKRRRLSIERLFNTGRLRRLYRKREYEDPVMGAGGYEADAARYDPPELDETFTVEEIMDFLDELEALERLRGSSAESEKRGKQRNGWYTGMFGKRSAPATSIRESRNFAQTFHNHDYFGKRFTGDDALPATRDWQRAFNLQDVTEGDME